MKNKALLSSLCVLAAWSLACGGAGGAECLGHVIYKGQTHQPEGGVSDPVLAQRNACNLYCREADPEYETMYQIWADSPRGDPKVPKQEAIFQSDDLMEYVTQTCSSRCVADVVSGKMDGGVDCH